MSLGLVKDNKHKVTFAHYVSIIWNFLSLDEGLLATLVYHLFDDEKNNAMGYMEITKLIESIHQKTCEASTTVRAIVDAITYEHVFLSEKQFRRICKKNRNIISPVISLHFNLRKMIKGDTFWTNLCNFRESDENLMRVDYVYECLKESEVGRLEKKMGLRLDSLSKERESIDTGAAAEVMDEVKNAFLLKKGDRATTPSSNDWKKSYPALAQSSSDKFVKPPLGRSSSKVIPFEDDMDDNATSTAGKRDEKDKLKRGKSLGQADGDAHSSRKKGGRSYRQQLSLQEDGPSTSIRNQSSSRSVWADDKDDGGSVKSFKRSKSKRLKRSTSRAAPGEVLDPIKKARKLKKLKNP